MKKFYALQGDNMRSLTAQVNGIMSTDGILSVDVISVVDQHSRSNLQAMVLVNSILGPESVLDSRVNLGISKGAEPY